MNSSVTCRGAWCLAVGLVVCLAMSLAAGCNTFGVIANDIAGTPEVEAKWIPASQPTLVLVENYNLTPDGDVECDRVGHYVMQDLQENKVVPLVDYSKVTTLRDNDPASYAKMSVAAIGRAVGATQVIYVNIRNMSSDTVLGTNTVKWSAAANVTVVNALNGKSLWPTDLVGGHPIAAETQYDDIDPHHDELLAHDDLDRNLAGQVGDLFHNWLRDTDSMHDD
jgi:hypothetical protein